MKKEKGRSLREWTRQRRERENSQLQRKKKKRRYTQVTQSKRFFSEEERRKRGERAKEKNAKENVWRRRLWRCQCAGRFGGADDNCAVQLQLQLRFFRWQKSELNCSSGASPLLFYIKRAANWSSFGWFFAVCLSVSQSDCLSVVVVVVVIAVICSELYLWF